SSRSTYRPAQCRCCLACAPSVSEHSRTFRGANCCAPACYWHTHCESFVWSFFLLEERGAYHGIQSQERCWPPRGDSAYDRRHLCPHHRPPDLECHHFRG